MKSIFLVLVFIIPLLAKPPSQNSALNSISPNSSSKKHDGNLQKSLDSWLKDDWEPTQKKIASEKKALHVKDKKEDNSTFKLQTYVDKWSEYNKEKASEPKKPSHVEMINSLPAIGK